jgi:hypothetical protein
MKSDLKIEFKNGEILNDVILESYFKEDPKGRLNGKSKYIEVTKDLDNVLFTSIKGLNKATIKIFNEEKIDGYCRFIINEEKDSLKIYPISIICVIDNGRYSFY